MASESGVADVSRLARPPQSPILTKKHLGYLGLAVFSVVVAICHVFVGPIYAVALIVALFTCIVLPQSPFLGVLGYVVFEYARIASAYPAVRAFQLGKLIVLATLAVFLARYVINRDYKFVSDRMYIFFAVWLGLAVISTAVALDRQMANEATLDLFKWFVICFLIIHLVDTVSKLQVFVWVYLLLNLKLAQFQIRAFLSGYASASDQWHFVREGIGAGSAGFFANGNDFGLAMAVVAPVAFYVILSHRARLMQIVAGGTCSVLIVALLRSGSRGAALGLAAAAGLVWLKSRNKLYSLALVLVFVAGFWAAAPDAWKDRFVGARNYEEDATASARLTLWRAGIQMFKDYPLTGVGIENFSANFVARYGATGAGGATVAHNIYIEAASELGAGGLLVVLAVIIEVFRRNANTRKLCREANLQEAWLVNMSHALDCSLLAFSVHGFFLTVLYYPHLYMIIAMAIALNAIARRIITAKATGENLLTA